MSTFDDREAAFEAKFVHDQEMQFRARARRNRLLALWACELMGTTGTASLDYASELLMVDLQQGGDEGIKTRLVEDLRRLASEDEITQKLSDYMRQAKAELLTEV